MELSSDGLKSDPRRDNPDEGMGAGEREGRKRERREKGLKKKSWHKVRGRGWRREHRGREKERERWGWWA